MTELLLPVGSWFGTFAVHSTLLLLAVWFLLRFVRCDTAREEILWRVALFAGVVTASVQRGFGIPIVPGWNVDFGIVATGVAATGATATGVLPAGVILPAGFAAPATATITDPGSLAAGLSRVMPGTGLSAPGIALGLGIALYLLVLIGLVTWRLRGWWAFHRRIRRRVPVYDTGLLRILVELLRAAGIDRPVRLSVSDTLHSPVAFGFMGLEICLPTAVITQMDAGRHRCVLAHEIAHLRAGDPRWLVAYELWTCVFFFQPLGTSPSSGAMPGSSRGPVIRSAWRRPWSRSRNGSRVSG